MRGRAIVWATAAVAAVLPRSGGFVERWYSSGVFPLFQRTITSISNWVPFALFDVLLAVVGVCVMVAIVSVVRRERRHGLLLAGLAVMARLTTITAVAYLAFLVAWGFNYRRAPITTRVDYDASRITPEGARRLAAETVARVNALHDTAHREAWPASGRVDPVLAKAFDDVQRAIGGARFIPARPKWTLLDLYFRRAGVAGMTDPYFLESLIASDLLVVERPFVVAHEWSHLAGIADEGEANYAGWLTCLRGSPLHQYSAWLFLYGEVINGLPPHDAQPIAQALAEGPRADLLAIRERLRQQLDPTVSAVGWRVYDQYLKANRVDEGTDSYAEVTRLVLGTAQ